MKRVYVTDSVPMAWHIKNVLEQQSIDAVIRNENLFSVSGEVPFTECMPEVWVKHDLDYKFAKKIITESESPSDEEEIAWECDSCGEDNAANYDICWNCQSAYS